MKNVENKIGLSVVGLGKAGLARCRSIGEVSSGYLVSTHSRRNVGSTSWNDILADPKVDAIVICTENSSHVKFIMEALLAKKHVAVEFPLVNEFVEAKELYSLAVKQQRVLHCEFIGLLTQTHLQRKQMMNEYSWIGVSCVFQGGLNPWLRQEASQGHHGQLSIGRLQALWDLAGPLRLETATLLSMEDGYQLDVFCSSAKNQQIHLRETRREGLSRLHKWNVSYSDKEPELYPVQQKKEGLFLQDLRYFLNQIQRQEESYVSSSAVLCVLQLAIEINRQIFEEK